MDFQFVHDKTVIYMDDIKITGSHERVIKKMISKGNPDLSIHTRKIFMYFAELANPNVDPTVENKLNYYFVNSLYQMDKVIKNEDWIPNTRAVKYILSNIHDGLSEMFFQFQPMKVLQNIYHLAIGNSYHLMDGYKDSIYMIRKILVANKLL